MDDKVIRMNTNPVEARVSSGGKDLRTGTEPKPSGSADKLTATTSSKPADGQVFEGFDYQYND